MQLCMRGTEIDDIDLCALILHCLCCSTCTRALEGCSGIVIAAVALSGYHEATCGRIGEHITRLCRPFNFRFDHPKAGLIE